MLEMKEKLQQLRLLLPDAKERNLLIALKLSNGQVDRALNIYLEQKEGHANKNRSLRQSKLDSFIKERQVEGEVTAVHSSSKRKAEELTEETSKDNSSNKKVLTLQEVLKWPPTKAPTFKERIETQTIYLYRQEDVSARTPCTLLHNVLPKELANSLLQIMLKESETFTRKQGFLFGKLATSPHTSQYYISNEMKIKSSNYARYFPPEMEQAKIIITNIVNEKRKERKK